MVIMTYVACLAIALMFPETSYTRDGKFEPGEASRTIGDHFKVWPASGGGIPKVGSLWHAFRYPWFYLGHPIVLLTTAYFSLFLACNDYLLTTNSISFPTEYGFSLSDVALTSIAPTLGNLLGIIYGGVANDKVSLLSQVVDSILPESN
jgi:hypothetical protein